MEQKRAAEGSDLNTEQVALLEKRNAQFKERHVESPAPGQLLSQDICQIGTIKGVGI